MPSKARVGLEIFQRRRSTLPLLLTPDDIGVEGGDYRLHDYVIVRMWLEPVCRSRRSSTVLVTFGSVAINQPEQRVATSCFEFSDIVSHQVVYRSWEQVLKSGHELPYCDFLLNFLRERSQLRLTFLVSDDKLDRLRVTLENVVVYGRFPQNSDMLGSHFAPVMAASEK